MGKIFLKSILSTSTQTKQYLKYREGTSIDTLFHKSIQNTSTKILAAGGGAISKCINMYGNVVTIKFWLIVDEND